MIWPSIILFNFITLLCKFLYVSSFNFFIFSIYLEIINFIFSAFFINSFFSSSVELDAGVGTGTGNSIALNWSSYFLFINSSIGFILVYLLLINSI